jgi:hypothetical protein
MLEERGRMFEALVAALAAGLRAGHAVAVAPAAEASFGPTEIATKTNFSTSCPGLPLLQSERWTA